MKMEYTVITGNNINHYLKEKGMTEIALANRIGVSKVTVSNWVNGKSSPRLDKIDKMCIVFGCKREDFLKAPDDKANIA
jgi:repressor LexA